MQQARHRFIEIYTGCLNMPKPSGESCSRVDGCRTRSERRRLRLRWILPLLSLCLAACGGGRGAGFDNGGTPSPSPRPVTVTDADRQDCVDQINQYRTSNGGTPLVRSSALESFGDTAAQNDAQANSAHAYWISTNGGNHLSLAQNEVLKWSYSQYGSIQRLTQASNQLYWNEGPSGEHYQNMADPTYTQAGCGFFVNGDSVTVTEDFR